MQSLNDDDMDELFRQAAEDYPLNTDGADWNKVMQQLHHTGEDLPEENKKKDYRYLWLLLLLPIGFICGRFLGNDNNSALPKTNVQLNTTATSGNKKEQAVAAITSVKAKTPADKLTGRNRTTNEDVMNSKKTNSGILPVGKVDKLVANTVVKNKFNNQADAPLKSNASLVKDVKMEAGKKNDLLNSVSSETALTHKQGLEEGTNVPAGKTVSNFNSHSVKSDTTAVEFNKKSIIQPGEKAETAIAKKSITAKPAFKRKLYYSFVTGPDLSLVKLERTSTVGYSVGLMLGYQFTGKMAVEAGALWDKKNYYAKGDYLDTGKLQLPMHSIVSKAEGSCNMIEIPVNIKYDFKTKKNHSWFISTGLSSYIMKKENYNLTYERYNQPFMKDYGYTNSSKDWFSVINVSAGYKTAIGKTNISIAPYAKLPLRGVGIGKLPITSTGLYFSIGRSVH